MPSTQVAFIEGKRDKDIFILKQLVGKDFKLKYRRSVLGIVWSVLNPLLMMIVMSLVFSFFLRFADIPHYPLYLIIGNIVWSVMNDSTSFSLRAIIDAAPLLKKVRVNKYVFPVEKVLFALVNFAFSLVAVVLVMVWEGVMPTWRLLLVPVCLFLLMLFCIGLSLILSALCVFFRDIIHLWSVLLTAWMYATPIFWPSDFIDEKVPFAAVRFVMHYNPMYRFISFMRDIFIYDRLPTRGTVMVCVISALVVLVIGVVVFRKTQKKFILYI